MKNLRYIFVAAFALLAMACSRDEASLFPESAAQRMNEAVEKYTKVLESAENGWKVQFYPNHDNQMGGYVFTFRFKEGVAYIRAEINSDPTEEFASLYQVKGEQECLLTFDSYNEVFHIFSEPSANSTTGMESDYEFSFKSLSADQNEILLKGKRYGQPLVLSRIADDEDPVEYMEQIGVMSNYLNSMMPRMVAVVDQEDEYEVNLSGGLLVYQIPNVTVVEGEEIVSYETFSFPYITTVEGLHFKDEVDFYGKKFQDCVYDPEEDCLTAVGADVYFPFVVPSGYRTYEELLGNYTFKDASGNILNPVVSVKEDGVSYNIKGMVNGQYTTDFTVEAFYNSTYGSLEIRPQYLGTFGSYYIWIFIENEEFWTWNPEAAIHGQNDEDGNITWGKNQEWTYMTCYACTKQNATGSDVYAYYDNLGENLVWEKVE